MIIDTSAILAILFNEEDANHFARAIANSASPKISAGNYLETAIVIDKQAGMAAGRQLDAFMDRAEISIEPITKKHADLARQAYLNYGKGNHKAGLNFGDCFSYALSIASGEPLLYKGNDFSQTDIQSVL